MSRRSRLGPALLATSLASCRPGGAPEAVTVPEWTVVEELRIGSVDDPSQSLTTVRGIAVDAEGRVYVGQPQDNVIRVFDPGGVAVRTIGGPGQGPGEFQRLVALGLLADTLYASDLTSRRVTFFSLDGTVLDAFTIRPPLDPPFAPFGAAMMFPDGSVLAPVGVPAGLPGVDLSHVPTLRADRRGEILDTFATSSYERMWTSIETDNGNPLTVTQTFDDEPIVAISRDGRRVATVERPTPTSGETTTFRVTVTDPAANEIVFTRAYEYLPVTIDPTVVDSAVAQSVRARLRFFTSQARAEAAVRAALRIPGHFLPVARAEYSEGGDLWLAREDLPDADQAWWVVGEMGDVVARVTLPMGFDPQLIRTDELWGVQPDELDVPYVVKYRIVR
ncbi:MAG: hypothetical protein AB7T31_03260 [Gemmatimonadales bacterium]